MAKKMLIDAFHEEETRVAVVDGNTVEEFDFESKNKSQLAGNIYLGTVTRVEPSLQAAFIDYGGNRHGFLAFSEIHTDYYQLPVEDLKALKEEELAYAETARLQAQETEVEHDRATVDSEGDETESSDRTIDNGSENFEVKVDQAQWESILEADDPIEGSTFNEPDDTESLADSVSENLETNAESRLADDGSSSQRPLRRSYRIQEVIRVRRPVLVQVMKEERGNKGAALTTYLSLAGRYCVLMPNTARGGGISRKIINPVHRRKLKDIATGIDVPQGAGLIVRTAGAMRTKAEIKRDYDYLLRLWNQIRTLTVNSQAPAKIYEEGDLIKRSIRDLYSRDIDEVLVVGDEGYRIAKEFMKMIMPSHSKKVRKYDDRIPLFARHQGENYLAGMFHPVVHLESGGYIVVDATEALVAIDVNSGRATRECSVEETALKTNLEAADEIARQLRLRDLAGLIVIDFIDMDERLNNLAVEKRFTDKLKTDRARTQVGRISDFGLLEMSRQRLRPSILEATTQPCPTCHGTGLVRSDDNLALTILRQLDEKVASKSGSDILVKCPVSVANFLFNQKRAYLSRFEELHNISVQIAGDGQLLSPEFLIERVQLTSRRKEADSSSVVSIESSLMDDVDSIETDSDASADIEEDSESRPKRRRRRRRRRKNSESQESHVDLMQSNKVSDVVTESSDGQDAEALDAPNHQSDTHDVSSISDSTSNAAKKSTKASRRTTVRRSAKSNQAQSVELSSSGMSDEETVLVDSTSDSDGVSDGGDAPVGNEGSEKTKTKPKKRKTPAENKSKKKKSVVTNKKDKVQSEPLEQSAAYLKSVADVQSETKPVGAQEESPESTTVKRRGWWSDDRD